MFKFTTRLILFTLYVFAMALGSTISIHAEQTPTPTPPVAAFTNNNVRQLIAIGKMRGHLIASIADWDNANYDLAMHHAAEISTELYSIIAADLKKAELDEKFLAAANAYAKLSMAAGDKKAVHDAYDALIGQLDDATTALILLAALEDVTFHLSVAQGLLTGMLEEYGEGVSGGKVVNVTGYQNAVGFLQVAKLQYAAAQKTFSAGFATAAKVVSDQYAALDKLLPADFAKTPDSPPDSSLLQAAVDQIKTIEVAAIPIDLEQHRSVPEILAAARTGLLDAINAYQSGNADGAYEFASSAYLDHYEGLEVDLRKKDSTLTDTIEAQFLAFAKLIKDGKPIDDLKTLFNQIDTNLTQAQTLLTS